MTGASFLRPSFEPNTKLRLVSARLYACHFGDEEQCLEWLVDHVDDLEELANLVLVLRSALKRLKPQHIWATRQQLKVSRRVADLPFCDQLFDVSDLAKVKLSRSRDIGRPVWSRRSWLQSLGHVAEQPWSQGSG